MWRARTNDVPRDLRRRIVAHSLYGVDLNPRAVRLCELRVLTSTRAYLTMELINGRPFVEWVRRGTPVGAPPNLLRRTPFAN